MHLQALGYQCQGVREGKKRDFYVFEYSEGCSEALRSFESAFKAIQSLQYVTAPHAPGNKES